MSRACAPGTLGAIPLTRRVGASVVAPDGLEAVVWSYSPGGSLHLWRDGRLLDPVAAAESRSLEVVGLHPIYGQDVKACTKADAHVWPDELIVGAECLSCGLPYIDFSDDESNCSSSA